MFNAFQVVDFIRCSVFKKAQNIETRDGGQNKRTEWY
jgi:hypothetical protein